VPFLALVAIVLVLAYRGTTAEDRAGYLRIALSTLKNAKIAAQKPRPEYEAFREALRHRTRYAVVTTAIVAVNAVILGLMLFGPATINDPLTLVSWGASLGPRTTNGEWWRLLTSTFVHTSPLHLVVDIAVLLQIGAVLERLVGRLTLAAVYLSAGMFGCLIRLSVHPVDVGIGASAAVFGLYGLLIAALAWQTFHRIVEPQPDPDSEDALDPDAERPIVVPFIAVKRIVICAIVFLVYSAFNGFAGIAEFAGLLVGVGYGLVLAPRAADRLPSPRHVAFLVAASLAAAFAFAVPLRNIADIQPAIAHVIATEALTAAKYQAASDAFKKGRITAEALARVAERTIVPELQAVDARLLSLKNVPPEHQPVVANAREYLRLRGESWRVRAEAVRRMNTELRRRPEQIGDPSWRIQAETRYRSNLAAMGKAEGAERAALDAFHKIKPIARAS
jgi:membrane associated rhomboid family serine protease